MIYSSKYASSDIEIFSEISLTVFEKKNSQKSSFSGLLTGHNPLSKLYSSLICEKEEKNNTLIEEISPIIVPICFLE
jgi:hypothetical protein